MSNTLHIKLNTKNLTTNLFLVIVTLEITLFLCDAFINYNQLSPYRSIRQMFNMTREDSVANWFASIQGLAVGITVWCLYFISRVQNFTFKKKLGYFLIAAFFTYVGFDDGCKFHERIGTVTADAFEHTAVTASGFSAWVHSFPSYTWHVIFTPFLIGFGIYMLVFLLGETRTWDHKFLLFQGICCFGLAVVMDFVEGNANLITQFSSSLQAEETPFKHFLATTEEFIELIGTTVFWMFFITILLRYASNLKIESNSTT